jgi:hypothetical protein
MGTLDDAIREHLELKRRLGASDEEIQRKENEAFGKGRLRAEPEPEPPQRGEAPPEQPIESPADAFTRDDLAAEPATNGRPAESPSDTAQLEAKASRESLEEEEIIEPDEVPAEEALEPELTVRDERDADDQLGDWAAAEGAVEPGEDVLEETPEFLEESPEEDRLWFEQRPPKDFDFD